MDTPRPATGHGWIAALAALAGLALSAACGDPIRLEDCDVGGFFAACSDRDPGARRFACADEAEDCRWFVGEDVAAGYAVSDCSPDDVCCHDGWPFSSSLQRERIGNMMLRWGSRAWDRDRDMNVLLRFDPDLAPRDFECDGDDPTGRWSGPCDGGSVYTSGFFDALDTLVLEPGAGGQSGWFPIVEVDLPAERARVCTANYEDVPRRSCQGLQVRCADRGTVTLSDDSGAPDGEVVVSMDVGFGEFALRGAFSATRFPR